METSKDTLDTLDTCLYSSEQRNQWLSFLQISDAASSKSEPANLTVRRMPKLTTGADFFSKSPTFAFGQGSPLGQTTIASSTGAR